MPANPRLANAQKSIRTNDIENVATRRVTIRSLKC